MIEPAPFRRSRPVRGPQSAPARIAAPLAAVMTLAACGPSPVDMVEHSVTTTPSRMAGEELQRSAEPEDSCAPAPVPTEFPGTGERRVDSAGPDGDTVTVPRSPERILALGAAAVDVACALGLQHVVVGTSGLPDDADVYLPRPLVDLPVVPLAEDTVADDIMADDIAADALSLAPDLVLLPSAAAADPDLMQALSNVAPTVVYDSHTLEWTDATETISDAYGRPRAGGDLLLDVISRAESTDAQTTPRDTRVSLVSVTVAGATVQGPDTLGSLMLEAVDAGRPPAQRTRDGERIPPAPESPPTGDELDGDVIFAVVGGSAKAEDQAREVFESDRWQELDAVGAQRLFVVDRATWEGSGPVAARAVLGDIGESINGIAPDG